MMTANAVTKSSTSKPADSVNILERIQSKIEEKMTRADTSNGLMGGSYRNHLDVGTGKKSSTSIGGPRRCPNLQRLIEKKKQEEQDGSSVNLVEAGVAVKSVRNGGSILMAMEGKTGLGSRAKTGELYGQNGHRSGGADGTTSRSLYPWEQRMLADSEKKVK